MINVLIISEHILYACSLHGVGYSKIYVEFALR